jgi:hypothetical protein
MPVDVTGINLLQRDQARAKALTKRVGGQVPSAGLDEPVDNVVFGYLATIGVGEPPKFCEHLAIKCIPTTSES